MRLLCVASLLLAGSLSIHAQTTTQPPLISVNVENGCIEGSVVDTNGAGIRIQIIAVRSDHGSSYEIGTDPDGHFRREKISTGEYTLATMEDYRTDIAQALSMPAPASAAVVTVPADGTCASVTLQRPVRARLRLTITDSLTAAPVAFANASFRFGANGPWGGSAFKGELLVPPLAELEVHVAANGYEDPAPIKISSLEPGEVRELAVNLHPIQAGCIRGSVVDAQNLPVSDVKVSAQIRMSDRGGNRSAHVLPTPTTDQEGRFSFDRVQPGEYSLFPRAENLGYASLFNFEPVTSVTVPSGAGCPSVTIHLGAKAGKLQFQVLDAVTHKVVEYSAWLWPPGSAASFSPIARPVLLPAFKQFEVSVRAQGYQSQQLTIAPLQPEELRLVTVELKPNGGSQ